LLQNGILHFVFRLSQPSEIELVKLELEFFWNEKKVISKKVGNPYDPSAIRAVKRYKNIT